VGLLIKIRLQESIVAATLIYSAEAWSFVEVDRKRLEASHKFHHTWLRKIPIITLKNNVRNEIVLGQYNVGNYN